MRVKDLGSIWGIPIMYFKDYGKKYKTVCCLLFFVDILSISVATVLMYYNRVTIETYWSIVVVICAIVHLLMKRILNQEHWEAFKFYKKFEDCTVIEKSYSMNETNLFSVLYCIGYKRLRRDKSFEYYCESILSACSEDVKRTKKILRYMRNYEDLNGNVTCYVIKKGRYTYFVDIKDKCFKEGYNDSNDNG